MLGKETYDYVDLKQKLIKYLKKNCIQYSEKLEKDIIKLVEEISENDNKEFMESLAKNLFKDNGLKDENMRNKIKELVEEYFIEKQQITNVIEKTSNDQIDNELFIGSSEKVTTKVFEYIKNAFISFTNTFKDKASKIVNDTKKLKTNIEFGGKFREFKRNLEKKMEKNVANLSTSLTNVFAPNTFSETNFNSTLFSIENKELFNLQSINQEIREFFVLSGKFSNQNCDDYSANYFPTKDFEIFQTNFKTELRDFNRTVQDDKYWDIDVKIPGPLVGAAAGATAGATAGLTLAAPALLVFPIMLPVVALVGVVAGGVAGSILGKGNDINIAKTKIPRFSNISQKMDTVNNNISQQTKDIIEKVLTSMDNFVKDFS